MYVRSKEHTSRDSSAAGRLRRGATLGRPGEPRAQHTARYPIFFFCPLPPRSAVLSAKQNKSLANPTPSLARAEVSRWPADRLSSSPKEQVADVVS
jgi:hypothetical protein